MIGRITSVDHDLFKKRVVVTLETDVANLGQISALQQHEKLNIQMSKYSDKRSLTANAYFHKLVDLIRIELSKEYPVSFARVKNELISKYGQVEYINGQIAVIKTQIPVDEMLEQEHLHLKACGQKIENGIEVIFYRVYRGSHTYNTTEMSALIRGTVEDAKELGIETLPKAEIDRLLELYGNGVEK